MGSTGDVHCGWCGELGYNLYIPDLTRYPLCDPCFDCLLDTGRPPDGGRVAATVALWRSRRCMPKGLIVHVQERIASFLHEWDAPWPDNPRAWFTRGRARPRLRAKVTGWT